MTTKQIVRTYQGSKCFLYDYPYLYTCSDNGQVTAYDLRDSSVIRRWGGHLGSILDIRKSGNSLFTAAQDGFVNEYDIASPPPTSSSSNENDGGLVLNPLPTGSLGSVSATGTLTVEKIPGSSDGTWQQTEVTYLAAGITCGFLLVLMLGFCMYRVSRHKSTFKDSTATTVPVTSVTSAEIGTTTFMAGDTAAVTANELSIPVFLTKTFNQDYVLGVQLGKGGGGSIYACDALDSDLKERSTRQPLVCKIVNTGGTQAMTDRQRRVFFQEISLIYRFRMSPYFVQLYAFSEKPACIIMRRYACDLAALVLGKLSNVPYTKPLVVFILKAVCAGVQVMHEAEIIHCDIKPSNVLLDIRPNGTLMPLLADLGISMILDAESLKVAAFETVVIRGASLIYAAPEVLKRFRNASNADSETCKKGDIYALAITTLEMLTRGKVWYL